jgi:NAD(P)-dependent dehydrogenase (short-subunit alcohol dehydrogenase family)
MSQNFAQYPQLAPPTPFAVDGVDVGAVVMESRDSRCRDRIGSAARSHRSSSNRSALDLRLGARRAFPWRSIFGPVYPASKTALNALTLAMAIELEPEGIKVNAVSPGFTKTNLNGYAGTETVEEGAREAVRVALLGPDRPTGTFTRWENETIPW